MALCLVSKSRTLVKVQPSQRHVKLGTSSRWSGSPWPLLERRQRRPVSPLVLGHDVSSVHRCHPRPAHLLGTGLHEKLGQQGAVVRGHPTPGPVVWDPGVGQAFPHHHVVACRGRESRLRLMFDCCGFHGDRNWTTEQNLNLSTTLCYAVFTPSLFGLD